MKERSEAHRRAMSESNAKDPIYELPHDIKVIGEYVSGRYVMCYIVAHSLFPNTKISKQNRQTVQRSRVVMTAALGRVLATNEHVHHVRKDQKHNDSLDNLEVMWVDEHNRHHKLGCQHSEDTKRRIAAAVQLAYEEGRHAPSSFIGHSGRPQSESTKDKLRVKRQGRISITDGQTTRYVWTSLEIPDGWSRGCHFNRKVHRENTGI
jgi:hypothetical protein